MYRIRYSTTNSVVVGTTLQFVSSLLGSDGLVVVSNDLVLRLFLDTPNYVARLGPIQESELLLSTARTAPRDLVFSRKPDSRWVSGSYDSRQYGSFLDNIQGFSDVLTMKPPRDIPGIVKKQHFTRHRNLVGRGSHGVVDLGSAVDFRLLHKDLQLTTYPSHVSPFPYTLSGSTVYDRYESPYVVTDVTPIFELLSKGRFVWDGDEERAFSNWYTGEITNFTYENQLDLTLSYHARYDWEDLTGVLHEISYDILYVVPGPYVYSTGLDSGGFYSVLAQVRAPYLRCSNYLRDGASIIHYDAVMPYQGYCYVLSIPNNSNSVLVESKVTKQLSQIVDSFADSCDLQLRDITALSRDTATTCLRSLSGDLQQSPVKFLDRLGQSIRSSDKLLQAVAQNAYGDVLRATLKELSSSVFGFSNLAKYRSLLGDSANLLNSLEALSDLKSSPNVLYTAMAHKTFPTTIAGRSCEILVHSKVYLNASPFGILQALVGEEAFAIIRDILTLYYSSMPLGILLVRLSGLREFVEFAKTRLFFEFPFFFIHSYTISSRLTQAELDSMGISNIRGSEAEIRYYVRDVSQHLPVPRFSNLPVTSDGGDVFNVAITLMRQLVAFLS